MRENFLRRAQRFFALQSTDRASCFTTKEKSVGKTTSQAKKGYDKNKHLRKVTLRGRHKRLKINQKKKGEDIVWSLLKNKERLEKSRKGFFLGVVKSLRLLTNKTAHTAPSGNLGNGHTGLFDTINNSLHFQLGLALASVGTICSLVA